VTGQSAAEVVADPLVSGLGVVSRSDPAVHETSSSAANTTAPRTAPVQRATSRELKHPYSSRTALPDFHVVDDDVYNLDGDGDGIACES